MSADVVVRIPEALRGFTGGDSELHVEAASVADAIGVLARTHADLINHICSRDGELRPFVNLYLGSDDVRRLEGLRTRLHAGDVVTILPSVAGG